MKDNIYITLLKILEENGLNKPYNVSPFMRDYFQRPNGREDNWRQERLTANNLLLESKLRGHIDFDKEDLYNAAHWVKIVNGNQSEAKWFDDDLVINFTLMGQDYLNKHIIEQSNQILTLATIKSIRVQKIVSILMVILSTLTLYVIYQSFTLSEKESDLKKYQGLSKKCIKKQI